MLMKQIVDGDHADCRHAIEADAQAKALEEAYYVMISKCPEEIQFDMERVINSYAERVIQIAYLQGIKDFANLCITLKEDVLDILKKCE